MPNNKLQKQLMGASAMVAEMSVLILAAAFAGGWADKLLNTSPLLLILGIFGGLAFGMMRLLKTLDKLDRDHKNEPNPPEDHP
jgi:F0F1-type ATP synthase assembly protein I